MEERFATEEIDRQVYDRVNQKYKREIADPEDKLGQNKFDSSKLEKAVERGSELAGNLSKTWASADFDSKGRLESLVFPEGILYDKKNDRVRTPATNALFADIPPLKRILEDKRNGNPERDCL